MIPLIWPNVYGDQGGETLVVEYEIEVPPEETEMIYANSPGSAGDISDFSSGKFILNDQCVVVLGKTGETISNGKLH